jgi:hypothetical protein
MVAHVSPAAVHKEESRNTLLYADRAKNISNKASNADLKTRIRMRLELQPILFSGTGVAICAAVVVA